MELKRIRELAKLLNTMGLEELSLEEASGEKITLRRPGPQPAAYAAPPSPPPMAPLVVPMAAVRPDPPMAPVDFSDLADVELEVEMEPRDSLDVVTVTSPLVGVFYAGATPGAPPLVSPGQRVRAGDVLCMIEAMKMMNQIVAEQDGFVLRCYPENGQLVEFGQPLFQLRRD